MFLRTVLTVAVSLCTIPATAQTRWSAPPGWTQLDRTLLARPCVVVGRLHRSAADELLRTARGEGGYVSVPLTVDRPLHCSSESVPSRLTFFAASDNHPFKFRPTGYGLSRELGEPRIFLLQKVGPRHFLADRFHHTSILPLESLEALQTRIELHNECAVHPLSGEAARHRSEVDTLCEALVAGGDAAANAWTAFQQLPCTAIVALITCLDDERPVIEVKLPIVHETPDRGTRLRWLVPSTVADVVREALHLRTGESFGPNDRQPTPKDWVDLRRCWQIYGHFAQLGEGGGRR